MRKIVLIGNGFDLANGLSTSYNHFIEYLKDSMIVIKNNSTPLIDVTWLSATRHSGTLTYTTLTIDGKEDPWIGATIDSKTNKVQLMVTPRCKSIYFKYLFNKLISTNWCDLETAYFEILSAYNSIPESVLLINKEFEHLKKLLKNYLSERREDKIFTPNGFTPTTYDKLFQLLKGDHLKKKSFHTYPEFITFNYTSKVLRYYMSELISTFPKSYSNWDSAGPSSKPIHIHGDMMNNSKNPIIFGYGDDSSKEYLQLKTLMNNDLLKYFKTFQYLRTNRYQKILNLLDKENNGIYIQVIGHSYGLGDRTLLKTIFEHSNVRKIEATYHKDEDVYFDNLYNMSRIFDSTELMRTKVVPLEETFML